MSTMARHPTTVRLSLHQLILTTGFVLLVHLLQQPNPVEGCAYFECYPVPMYQMPCRYWEPPTYWRRYISIRITRVVYPVHVTYSRYERFLSPDASNATGDHTAANKEKLEEAFESMNQYATRMGSISNDDGKEDKEAIKVSDTLEAFQDGYATCNETKTTEDCEEATKRVNEFYNRAIALNGGSDGLDLQTMLMIGGAVVLLVALALGGSYFLFKKRTSSKSKGGKGGGKPAHLKKAGKKTRSQTGTTSTTATGTGTDAKRPNKTRP